jgi:hypothetical protein
VLLVELVVVALGAVAVGRAVRERARTRAMLERASMADRRYRAWSGERARAMAARNTLSDVAQASGEAARKVQRGSTAVAGALGSLGGRLTDSVRRLAAASSPELAARANVVKGTVVSSSTDKADWFALMLEAAEAEDKAREEGRAELPTAPMPGVVEAPEADEQPWEDDEEQDDPSDLDTPGDASDVEATVVVDVSPDLQWLEDVPRDR